jgi:branched-chain amino acid transport system ATP-binding protein
MREDLLSVRNLTAGYGLTTVLRDVELTAGSGQIVAVVGSNGAGKTTLARALTGFAKVTAGSVRFDGHDALRLSAHARARAGLVQVPEGRRLFARFSVEQNLAMSFMGGAKKTSSQERDERLARVFELFPILRQRRDQVAGTLSGGEQQMLSIARAILLEPRVLILDEPSTGLAPLIIKKILDVVAEIVSQTRSCCVLIEQRAKLALDIANRGYLLERGRIVTSGSPEEVMRNPLLERGYVGG